MPMSRDFGLKALALGLAVLLWLAVSAQRLEQVSVRTFDVPVALVGVPRDLIITGANPSSVSVRLRGRTTALRGLSSQNLEATINLSDSRAGNLRPHVTSQALNVPEGIEVLSIDPGRMNLKLEPRRQKSVRIRPFFVGELPPGYQYDREDVSVDPTNALISGPTSIISDISEVATERIILSGRIEPFRQRVAVVADSPLIRVVEPANAVVEVVIRPPNAPASGSEPSSSSSTP